MHLVTPKEPRMCLSPVRLKNDTLVACRYCRVCLDNRKNDLIGRCLAEQSTSSGAFSVTLTYAADGPHVAVLRYSDVQDMLKRIRKAGYKVRYIAAGEYGTKKGRAHWHVVVFFEGDIPEHQLDTRFSWKFWPHGFAYFQRPDYKGFGYAMKYALKQVDDLSATKALAMSKKPPLGYRFFMELADDMVSRRLAFHSPEYAFSHVCGKDGRPRRFWLRGRMFEFMCDRYYTMWRMQYGDDPPWSDYFLERYLDKIARRDMDRAAAREVFEPKPAVSLPVVPRSVAWLLVRNQKDCIVDAWSDRTAIISKGDERWHVAEINGIDSLGQLLLRIGFALSNVLPVLAWLEDQWSRLPPLSTS